MNTSMAYPASGEASVSAWRAAQVHFCIITKIIIVLLRLHGGDDDDKGASSPVIPDHSFSGRRSSERSRGCSEPWLTI